jgi:hypothetical protein
MTSKVYAALIASVGAVALIFAANESFARTGTASRGFTPAHSISHPAFAHSLRHSRRRNAGLVWATDSYGYGSPDGAPLADGTASPSGDVHYTTTYDVPWDWAHRLPPNVTTSDRPYVPSCPTQVVTVPGRNGTSQNVNVTQCF